MACCFGLRSRPQPADCEQAACGAKKFFCGWKHKFGLNLQGTCDAEGRFLDISIAHPASCSDFLAYTTSKFCKKLEVPGFLAPGLCLFGDSAYVTNSFFVTPYKHAKNGVRDDFNFYQSQLRINIECAFGMLIASSRSPSVSWAQKGCWYDPLSCAFA
jgi:DDE superfamily endonuclease